MTMITIPDATMPLVGVDGVSIDQEWYRWARDITDRAGGVSGVGTDDLDRFAFSNVGAEEFKALAYSVQDEQRHRPPILQQDAIPDLSPDLESIRAQMFALQQLAPDDQWRRPQPIEQEVITQLVSDIASIQAQMFALRQVIESLQQGTML